MFGRATRAGALAAAVIGGVPATALAAGPTAILKYEIYAAGLRVVHVQIDATLSDAGYGLSLGFTTNGMYGALFPGAIVTDVQGRWEGDQAAPMVLTSRGHWHGGDRQSRIEYQDDRPIVKLLVPPNSAEREEVPPEQQAHTIDTLSAIALLVHRVAATGKCEGSATTYDGRRLSEITAVTHGEETLAPTNRSRFSGPTLRCDFTGRMIAGFKHDDDPAQVGRPKHGSAWLAQVVPGDPPLPVRLSFETNWFGDAEMYLEDASVLNGAVTAKAAPAQTAN